MRYVMNYEEFVQLGDELTVKFNKWYETSKNKPSSKLLVDHIEWNLERERILGIENTDGSDHNNTFVVQTVARYTVEMYSGISKILPSMGFMMSQSSKSGK